MSINTDVSKVQYAGNDAATVFDFPYYYGSKDYIYAVRSNADGTDTVLVQNTDFTVSAAGNPAGGTVTYPISGSPLATGERITIYRMLPIKQGTALSSQGSGYFLTTIEDMADYLTQVSQQLQEQLDRTPSFRITDEPSDDPLEDISLFHAQTLVARDEAQAAAATAEAAAISIFRVSAYASLADAVAAAGSNKLTLTVDEDCVLTDDLVIPSTLDLNFIHGSVISGAYTLTVNGAIIAPLVTLFDSSLTIDGNPRNGTIYAAWFGAANGVESAAAINAALQLASGNVLGRTVYLAAGQYLVSETIHIPDYCNLVGEGQEKTLLLRTGDYGDTVALGDDGGNFCTSISISGIWFWHNIVYENGGAPGDFQNGISTYPDCAHIHVYCGININIDNVEVWNLPYGIRLRGAGGPVNITNCRLRGLWDHEHTVLQHTTALVFLERWASALVPLPTDIRIARCKFLGYLSPSRTATLPDAKTLPNMVENIGARYGVLAESYEVLHVAECELGGLNEYGVYLHMVTGAACLNATISENFFDGNRLGAFSMSNGTVTDTIYNTTFANNVCVGQLNTYNGINIPNTGTNTAAAGLAISGNTLNAFISTGVVLGSVAQASISGNSIRYFDAHGLYDASAEPAKASAILCDGKSENVVIVGNQLGGGNAGEAFNGTTVFGNYGVYLNTADVANYVVFSNDSSLTESGDLAYGPALRAESLWAENGASDSMYGLYAVQNNPAWAALRAHAKSLTNNQPVIYSDSERAANTAFSFLSARSDLSGTPDDEFVLAGDGNGYCDGAWTGGGADYGEYFEWADGNPENEDRIGTPVVLDMNGTIRQALEGEVPFGVISGMSSVIGNSSWNKWSGKYLRDDYQRYALDDEGNRMISPDWDPEQEYMPRAERAEWDVVGILGRVRIKTGAPVDPSWVKLRDISDTVSEWLIK